MRQGWARQRPASISIRGRILVARSGLPAPNETLKLTGAIVKEALRLRAS